DAVRALELRIAAAARTAAAKVDGDDAPSASPPADYPTHVGLMFDLIALAFASDATRVVTFLMANEVSGRNFDLVEGCRGKVDESSHHEGGADEPEPYRRISSWHGQQYAGLLVRLAAVDEGGDNLLDRSMVVLASATQDGNADPPHDRPR